MTLIGKTARRAATAAAGVALLLGGLAATATPADAAEPCGIYNLIGGKLTPHTLGGYRVYLCYSDIAPGPYFPFAPFTAWAKAKGLPAGAILSIDRSKSAITNTEWPTTSQVSASGGWTYKERTSAGGAGTWTEVGEMEAYKNAVRICLRLSGTLYCQSTWFADQDY
ncbi:hypothetical protein [Herbidospora sp. RD11066]